MKLLRYGPIGKEKPGILDAEGKIRDLSSVIPELDGSAIGPKALDKLRKLKLDKLPLVKGNPRIGSLHRQSSEVHRHRPELFRPRRRIRFDRAARADHFHQAGELPLRPE